MDIFVTVSVLLVSVFWFYAAYLRKIGSDKLRKGAMAMPDMFGVKVLISMGAISALIFAVRLLPLLLDLA